MTLKPVTYRTESEIQRLVHAFEQGSLPNSEFNHHAHMTVALWYLMHYSYPDAVIEMRTHIRHFASAHGQSQLYNETITLFWLKLLRHLLDRADPAAPFAETVYRILSDWGSMLFVFKHYSQELVFSDAAKQSWVEPDLRPLGFEI